MMIRRSTTKRRHLICNIAALFVGGGIMSSATQAATYTWTPTAAGTYNWNNAGAQNNWTAGFPNAAGDVADLNIDIAGTQTLNLNTAITVGTLNIGDASNSHAFTVAGNGGTLIFDNNGSNATLNETGALVDLISAPITLNDNLDVSVGGALTLSGAITTSSGKTLTKTGAGTLTISGNNTHTANISSATGLTLSTAGTTNFNGNVSLTGGTLSITSAGTTLAGTGLLTLSGVTIDVPNSGIGTIINMNQRWNGNVSTTLVSASGQTITSNGTVTLGANVSVANKATMVFNAAIGETGGTRNLTLTNNSGTNTVVFNAANTYTGTTTLSSGFLRLTHTNALASSSQVNLATGTTLQLRSNSAATFNGATVYASTSGNNNITFDVNNNGSGSGNELTYSGGLVRQITGGSVTTLNVTGGNTYALNLPTVNLYGGNSLTLNPTTANVSIGTLTATTGATSSPTIAAGNITLVLGGTGTTNTIGNITETSNAAQQLIITKNTAATWTVGNVDTKQGNTHTVSAGTLNLTGTFTFGTSSARTFTISGTGTLGYNNPGAVNTIGSTVGRLTFNGGTLDNTSGAAITTSTYNPAMTWSGNWTFAGSNGANSSLNLGTGLVDIGTTVKQVTVTNAASTLTVGGVLSGVLGGVTKAGPGTLVLSGANTFTGAVTVSAGTLSIPTINNVSANGTLGNSATAVTLGGSGTTGTLQYTGAAAASTKPFSMATGGTGAFDVTNGNVTLTLSAATAGAGALTKVGSGTLSLTAAPGHTGGTTVNRGTLLLSGANNMPATGTLTVNSGGVFSLGDGTARNTTAASLALTTGSTLVFDWNAAVLDNLASTAAATTSGIVGIQLNNTSPSGSGGNLISSASGGLDGATYYLANATNYTATLSTSANTVSIGSQTSVTALTSMYWTGNTLAGTSTSGVDNALALSNGTVSNWSSSPLNYTATGLTPGSTADVFFSNVQASKAQQTTVLGADMTVNSVTIDDSTAVTLGGTNSLKLLATGAGASSVDQGTGVGTAGGAALTVTANAANPTISANIILGSANQTWRVATGKTLAVSGSISGANAFSITGGGTLALSGANFYTGSNTVLGGSTLQIDAGGTIGNGSNALILGGSGNTSVGKLTINASATAGAITVNTDTTTNNTLTIASGQTLTATTLTVGYFLAGANRNTRLNTSGGGNLILSGVVNMNVVGDASNSANAVVDLSNLSSFSSGSGSGTFTVGAGLNGKGTMTLAANSNVINAATISLGDSGSGNYNLASISTMNLGAGTNTLEANSILLGAGKGAGTIQFAGSGGSVTIAGANGTGNATILMNDNSAGTNTGQTGSLLLEGHTATVSAGAVTIAQKSGTALGGSVPGLITFDTGTFSATSIVMANNTGATGASGSITGTLRVGGAAANSAATGVMSISGNMLLARTTAVGTTNSTTGVLTINGGTVSVNTTGSASGGIFDSSTVGTSTTTVNLQGGTLNLNGGRLGSATITGTRLIDNLNLKSGTLRNVLEINDGAAWTKSTDGTVGGGTLNLAGANAYTGDITIAAGILAGSGSASGGNSAFGAVNNTRTINVNSGTMLRFDSGNMFSTNFSASAVPSLNINGGTVTNSGSATNNALGNVTLSSGALNATVGHATYGAFNLNGTITSTGTSTISSSDPVNARMMLSSAGANNVDTPTTFNVTSGTLNVTAVLADLSAAESKISGLSKSGAGTMVLSAANTYTGTTTVSQGTLLVNNTSGSGTGSGPVIVQSGATLGGTGTVGSLSVSSGGILSPGSSPGNLNAGATTLTGGSIYNWEVNNAAGTAGSQWDLTTVTGALNLGSLANTNVTTQHTVNLLSLTGGNVAGDLTGFSNASNYTWKIYDSDTAISGFSGDLFNVNSSNFKYGGNQSPTGTFTIVLGTDPNVSGGDNTELYVRYAANLGGGNNSQIMISAGGGTAQTPGTGASTKTVALSNVFVALAGGGTATTATQTLDKTGSDDTNYQRLTFTGDIASSTFPNTSTPTGAGNQPLSGTITLNVATSGNKSGTVTIDNLAIDGSGGLGSTDADDVFTVTQSVWEQASLSNSLTGTSSGNLNITNASATDAQRAGVTISALNLGNGGSGAIRSGNWNTPTISGGGLVSNAIPTSAGAETIGAYSLKSNRINNDSVAYTATVTPVGDYTNSDLLALADPSFSNYSLSATITGQTSTANRTGGINDFGTASTAFIANGGTLAGYYTLTTAQAANSPSPGDRQVLGTTATIVSGTAASDLELSMAWRARTATEADLVNNPTALLSDVVRIEGLGSETYLLTMTYDIDQFGLNENSIAVSGELQLAWYNGSSWVNAIDGNTGGSFPTSPVLGAPSGGLGSWGVDTSGPGGQGYVWAYLNHNSDFAVIPEPSTLVFGGLALLGFAGVGLRKRRRLQQSTL